MIKKYAYSFYMIGNYDLSSYVRRDLYKKLGGHHTRGSNKINDVICYSSYYYYNKLINNIYYGNGRQKIPFAYKINKNIMSLGDFLSFVKCNFYARHYVLNLWGHGYIWQYVLPFYNMYTNNIQYIELEELKSSLSNNKFDVVIFETCAGMNLETIYELRNETKYICGNCDYTSYEGIDHKNIIKCNDNPNLFCKSIVDNMKKEKCPSFMETKRIVYIKRKIKKISKNLVKNKRLIIKLKKGLKNNLIDKNAIDLGYLLDFILKNSESKNLKYDVNLLYKYLKKYIYCVPKKRFKKNNCCGISIYFPREKKEYYEMIEKYKKLEFCKNNEWLKVIERLQR
jgi:hypothetical protein